MVQIKTRSWQQSLATLPFSTYLLQSTLALKERLKKIEIRDCWSHFSLYRNLPLPSHRISWISSKNLLLKGAIVKYVNVCQPWELHCRTTSWDVANRPIKDRWTITGAFSWQPTRTDFSQNRSFCATSIVIRLPGINRSLKDRWSNCLRALQSLKLPVQRRNTTFCQSYTSLPLRVSLLAEWLLVGSRARPLDSSGYWDGTGVMRGWYRVALKFHLVFFFINIFFCAIIR